MLPSWVADMVANPAVTPDALRLVLYVASLGEGEHEIPAHTLRMLLRCRSDRPIYEAREIAEGFGLRWKQGGRNHPNAYTYLGPGAEVSDDTSAQAPKYPPTHPTYLGTRAEVSDTSAPAPKYPETYLGASAEVSGYLGTDDEVSGAVGSRKEVGSITPPVVPPVQIGFEHPLSSKAQALLVGKSDEFEGFRGALSDYLQTRVPPDRQYAYLQVIATWLAGRDASVFRLQDGSRAPPTEIPGILAAGLNELLATGEKEMKWPEGDVRNLKTKLSILCRQRGDHERRNGSHGGRTQGQGGSQAVRLGSNQPAHTWEE